MKKLTLAISAVALAAGGAAYADHHMGGKRGADADGDGVVTRAEHDAHAAQRFARMDANNDGVVNETDREARHEAMRTQMFARLDADSNGSISREEFMSADHRMSRRGGDRSKMRGHGMMRMGDTDNDGSISQAEFSAAAATRFQRMDANNDGQVTKAERQAARAQMREERRERRGAAES